MSFPPYTSLLGLLSGVESTSFGNALFGSESLSADEISAMFVNVVPLKLGSILTLIVTVVLAPEANEDIGVFKIALPPTKVHAGSFNNKPEGR